MLVDVLKLSPETGEIGLEIEVEGANLPSGEDVKAFWKQEVDPSLRGESCEYVLKKPVSRDYVGIALACLKDAYKKKKSVISKGHRAGIHVHVNVQDLSPKQLVSFATLYFMFEECLIRFCADSRLGNHFCLRVSDANYIVDLLTQAVSTGNLRHLHTDDIRYSGLNFTSLFKCSFIVCEFDTDAIRVFFRHFSNQRQLNRSSP